MTYYTLGKIVEQILGDLGDTSMANYERLAGYAIRAYRELEVAKSYAIRSEDIELSDSYTYQLPDSCIKINLLAMRNGQNVVALACSDDIPTAFQKDSNGDAIANKGAFVPTNGITPGSYSLNGFSRLNTFIQQAPVPYTYRYNQMENMIYCSSNAPKSLYLEYVFDATIECDDIVCHPDMVEVIRAFILYERAKLSRSTDGYQMRMLKDEYKAQYARYRSKKVSLTPAQITLALRSAYNYNQKI